MGMRVGGRRKLTIPLELGICSYIYIYIYIYILYIYIYIYIYIQLTIPLELGICSHKSTLYSDFVHSLLVIVHPSRACKTFSHVSALVCIPTEYTVKVLSTVDIHTRALTFKNIVGLF